MSKRLLSMVSAMRGGGRLLDDAGLQRPAAPVPDAWPALQSATALGDSGRAPTVREWREYFPDPRLQALIATALEHNRDLRIAVARVEEARAQAGLARADRLPQIDLAAQRAASLTPADLSATNRQLNTQRYDVNLGVSAFELDFWGRVKSLDEAARANFLASEYAQKSFRLALVAMLQAPTSAPSSCRSGLRWPPPPSPAVAKAAA
jgi:multidrug efflux system outer membrane protein